MGKTEEKEIKPVSEKELPPEFKRFDKPFGLEQHVFNTLFIGIFAHSVTAYSFLYLVPNGYIPFKAFVLFFLFGYTSAFGTTVGAHRYWTHRTFKAAKPLQYILMLLQTMMMQYPIFKWCRDHRVHHKYTDTDADPHSSARGFWFSHITWLFQPKHPKLVEALKVVDISDLARDPVVRFQSKYYWEIFAVIFLIVPMGAGRWLCPDMPWFHIFCWNITRYVVSLHMTFLVNSFAHLWGDKPYDKYITSSENKVVSLLAVGEGWHNYHHTFPWDYKSAELGYRYNLSTVFIHFFAMIGWATDLKSVSHKLLLDRINRTGDGSHPLQDKTMDQNDKAVNEVSDEILNSRSCWGWGDGEIKEDDVKITETIFATKSHRG